jgi:hypothetical protein
MDVLIDMASIDKHGSYTHSQNDDSMPASRPNAVVPVTTLLDAPHADDASSNVRHMYKAKTAPRSVPSDLDRDSGRASTAPATEAQSSSSISQGWFFPKVCEVGSDRSTRPCASPWLLQPAMSCKELAQ